jgi:hypothetical protein
MLSPDWVERRGIWLDVGRHTVLFGCFYKLNVDELTFRLRQLDQWGVAIHPSVSFNFGDYGRLYQSMGNFPILGTLKPHNLTQDDTSGNGNAGDNKLIRLAAIL